MPLYLCQSGLGHAEPWRQGMSVYATPYKIRTALDSGASPSSASTTTGVVIRRIRHAEVVLVDDICIAHGHYWLRLRWPGQKGGFAGYIPVQAVLSTNNNNNGSRDNKKDSTTGLATTAAGRNASYAVKETGDAASSGFSNDDNDIDSLENIQDHLTTAETEGRRGGAGAGQGSKDAEELDNLQMGDDDEEDEEDDEDELGGGEGLMTPSAADASMTAQETVMKSNNRYPVVACLRTGIAFLSSDDMHLLPLYDDGLSPPVATLTTTSNRSPSAIADAATAAMEDNQPPQANNTLYTTEPVLCRICREGLHDDADDEQPTATADNEAEEGGGGGAAAAANRAAAAVAAVVGNATGAATGNRTANDNSSNRRVIYRLSSRQSSNNDLDDEDEDELDNVVGSSQEDFVPSEETGDDEDDLEPNENATAAEEEGASPKDRLSKPPPFTGPIVPHPHYAPNQPVLDNPLLAPCECSGSMAFVHYLCVEQWRCRSRHPEAQNGLNCETCGSRYALPPPTSRPVNMHAMEQQQQQAEDWLDAMPPHVMQALRNPHFMWQIGTAVVRRRWLRPLAPVLMSPIVALYCRARRLLKKRGVARRRWACSLCRRRARWKCVRCLRSYYCSRHCQNVAWHIIHKHVCYKPVRLWWSTVVYGALCLATFPGILRDPLMYDLGLFLLPFSFIVIGILAGGLATTLKKTFGFDMRGRALEVTVVLGTLWLTIVSWGLVQGFFGQANSCRGSLGRRLPIVVTLSEPSDSDTTMMVPGSSNHLDVVAGASWTLYWIQRLLLFPAQAYYLMWDRLASNSGSWLKSVLCLPATSGIREASPLAVDGCFEYLPHANANFFLSSSTYMEEAGGSEPVVAAVDVEAPSKCAADLLLVWYLYLAAGFAYVGSALYKQRERRQRRLQHQNRQQQQQQQQQQLHHHHHHHHHHRVRQRPVLQPRPHQD